MLCSSAVTLRAPAAEPGEPPAAELADGAADGAADDALVRASAAQILNSLDFRYQEQLTLLRGGALPSGRLGLVELGAGASFWSFGASGAVGFERVPGEALHGGYAHVAAEWRPAALTSEHIARRPAFHWLDPFIALGTRLGALHHEGGARFLAALTLGAGIDVGLPLSEIHPVLTLRYRVDALNHPVRDAELTGVLGTPEHFLLFGVGIRTAD